MGLGLGFASRASEREEHGDDECRHDPEVDAASHFWLLSAESLVQRREGKDAGRKEGSYVSC